MSADKIVAAVTPIISTVVFFPISVNAFPFYNLPIFFCQLLILVSSKVAGEQYPWHFLVELSCFFFVDVDLKNRLPSSEHMVGKLGVERKWKIKALCTNIWQSTIDSFLKGEASGVVSFFPKVISPQLLRDTPEVETEWRGLMVNWDVCSGALRQSWLFVW